MLILVAHQSRRAFYTHAITVQDVFIIKFLTAYFSRTIVIFLDFLLNKHDFFICSSYISITV